MSREVDNRNLTEMTSYQDARIEVLQRENRRLLEEINKLHQERLEGMFGADIRKFYAPCN